MTASGEKRERGSLLTTGALLAAIDSEKLLILPAIQLSARLCSETKDYSAGQFGEDTDTPSRPSGQCGRSV